MRTFPFHVLPVNRVHWLCLCWSCHNCNSEMVSHWPLSMGISCKLAGIQKWTDEFKVGWHNIWAHVIHQECRTSLGYTANHIHEWYHWSTKGLADATYFCKISMIIFEFYLRNERTLRTRDTCLKQGRMAWHGGISPHVPLVIVNCVVRSLEMLTAEIPCYTLNWGRAMITCVCNLGHIWFK